MLSEEFSSPAVIDDAADEGRPMEMSITGEIAEQNREERNESTGEIRNLLLSLVMEIREQNAIAKERERVIDRLHGENQSLRRGELHAAMAPLFRDLVALHDDLDRTARHHEASGEGDGAAAGYRSLAQALVDILARYGVECYDAEVGAPYNAREHRAAGTAPTADRTLDRCISAVLRRGFRDSHRIMRPLEAVVMKFQPDGAENQAPAH